MASTSATENAGAQASTADLTPDQKKAVFRGMVQTAVAQLPALPDTLEEFDINIPVQDGWQSRTKIVRPKATEVATKRPLIIHFFGGGMVVGEPEQLLSPAREFAETYGAVVALPSYRLTPDVRWPVPYKDAWDVIVWLSKHAEEELGANLDAGFVVGGASAGGSIAAACGGLAMFPSLQEAQEAPKLAKLITGQFLCVPGLIGEDITLVPEEYRASFTSWEENSNVEGFNAAGQKQVFESLQCTNYRSLFFSPMAAITSQEPTNKIPVYLEYCGLDPLRDEAIVYGKLLESRGVQTKQNLFAEDVHGSWSVMNLPSEAKNPTTKEAQMAGMKWLLSFS
jgi:acetyl esterase/lipase